jgi:site-specific DNA recombinase
MSVCKEFASNYGFEITRIYKDVCVLGEPDKRPELKRLLRDSRQDIFGVVLVYHFDRIARNLADMLKYCRKLKNQNKHFFSVTSLNDGMEALTLYDFLADIFNNGGKR